MTNTDTNTEATNSELPEGWSARTMGEVGKYLNGFAFNSKSWATTGRPIIRIQNLTGSGSEFNYFDGEIDERYIVRTGDLLFSWSATLGVYVWRGAEAVLNQHIFKIESNINLDFHRYLIERTVAVMAQQTHGTGMVHITKKKFEALPLSIPPLAEQERIVEILEEQLSRLDAALESVRVVREKAAQFRRSLLHAAFTGALTGHDPEDGQLPEGWMYLPLGELATLSLGKMLDRKQFTGMHPVPYLRNINVRWDRFDLGDLQEMDITPAQLDRVSLCAGDLVACEGGEPGRAAVWGGTESIAIQKALHRVRPVDRIKPRFLYFAFEAEFRGVEDHPLFTGTTIKHLPKEKIAAVMVPLPPLDEQVRIVQILEEQLSRLDAALAVANTIEKRSAALRRSLLHAAFTGRLTEQWRESVHV